MCVCVFKAPEGPCYKYPGPVAVTGCPQCVGLPIFYIPGTHTLTQLRPFVLAPRRRLTVLPPPVPVPVLVLPAYSPLVASSHEARAGHASPSRLRSLVTRVGGDPDGAARIPLLAVYSAPTTVHVVALEAGT